MFLETLARASIQGAFLITLLYLGLASFPAIPPLVRLWLWRVVFIKLVVSLIPFAVITLNVLPAPQPSVTASEVRSESPTSIAPKSDLTLPTPERQQLPFDPWFAFWMIGVSTFAFRFVYQSRVIHRTAENAQPVTDSDL